MPELELELTLAGADTREAAQLAALLERAAEPARFEVPAQEIEDALARARPARRRGALPRVAVGAAALAAAVLALVLVLPAGQQSVQARALAAFGGDDTVLHLREEVFSRIAGTERTQSRNVWYDPSRGRASWRETGEDGTLVAQTLVTPARFDRVVVFARVHLFGTSCGTIAAGCSQLLDPVSRYREALARANARPARTTFAGRTTYRLTLPLQDSLEQIVYVDAQTFLPRTIVWREHGVVVSMIDVADVERVTREDVPATAFARPRGGRPVSVAPAGRPRSTRRLTPAQAHGAFWLGPRGLESIVERRYVGGTATIAHYRTLDVWTYRRVVPPELLAPRLAESKTLVLGGVPATFFPFDGRAAVVRDGYPSVAVVGFAGKEELFDALGRVRLLR